MVSSRCVDLGASLPERLEVLRTAKKVLGAPVKPEDLATLIGAPDDALVTAYVPKGTEHVSISMEIPGILTASRDLHGDYGPAEIRNHSIRIHPDYQRQGRGTKIFARQVEHAGKLGVKRISCLAGADQPPENNGYYTWPALGFDAEIPAGLAAKLPEKLAGAKRLSELFASREGADWWLEHGITMEMRFDMDENSVSRKRLADYLASKRAEDEGRSLEIERSAPATQKPGIEYDDLDADDYADLLAMNDRIIARMKRKSE